MGTELPCAYIDGTSGFQCVLSMCRFRGFPSKGSVSTGDLETPSGLRPHSNFYTCVPAMLFLAAYKDGKNPSIDELINEQRQCSHYDTERKKKIMKKFHFTPDS